VPSQVLGPWGYPGGNRGAPPRGVDVKPLAGGGSQGPGRPRVVPGPCPGGLARDPGSRRPGSRRPWVPESPAPGLGRPFSGSRGPGGSRTPSRRPGARGFYINPSRRGPAVPGGGPLDLGVPKVRKGPSGGPWATPAPGGLQTPLPRKPRGPGARG